MSNQLVKKKQEIQKLVNMDEIKQRLVALFKNDTNKAEKFKATLLNIALDPSLSNCSPQSIVKSALTIAEVGLNPSKALGQAYIVKYKSDAQPVIGYKGWLRLAEEAGKIVKSVPVFKCDNFKFKHTGFDEEFILEPNYEEREDDNPKWIDKNLIGVVVSIKDLRGGYLTNTFVSIKKIKQIAGKSPSKNSKFSPYVDWNLEMFQAKAIKYVLSKTAMPENIAQAVEIDNQLDKQLVKEVKDTPELGIDDINDVDFEIIDEDNQTDKPKTGGLLDDREG